MAGGHVAGASAYAGMVMMLVCTLSFTGVLMPWWTISTPGMKGESTLWTQSVTMHVGSGGAGKEVHETGIAWEDVCEGSSQFPSDSCHRIRAIRAMALLALFCAAASSFAAFAACSMSRSGLLRASAGLAVFCANFGVAGIAVAATVDTSAENDLDGGGFISLLVGSVGAALGAALSVHAWRRSGKPQAESVTAGSKPQADSVTAESAVVPGEKLPHVLGRETLEDGGVAQAKLKPWTAAAEVNAETAAETDPELGSSTEGHSNDLLSI